MNAIITYLAAYKHVRNNAMHSCGLSNSLKEYIFSSLYFILFNILAADCVKIATFDLSKKHFRKRRSYPTCVLKTILKVTQFGLLILRFCGYYCDHHCLYLLFVSKRPWF